MSRRGMMREWGRWIDFISLHPTPHLSRTLVRGARGCGASDCSLLLLRDARGPTLAQPAERTGMDAPALSRLETAKMLNPRSRRCANGRKRRGGN